MKLDKFLAGWTMSGQWKKHICCIIKRLSGDVEKISVVKAFETRWAWQKLFKVAPLYPNWKSLCRRLRLSQSEDNPGLPLCRPPVRSTRSFFCESPWRFRPDHIYIYFLCDGFSKINQNSEPLVWSHTCFQSYWYFYCYFLGASLQ